MQASGCRFFLGVGSGSSLTSAISPHSMHSTNLPAFLSLTSITSLQNGHLNLIMDAPLFSVGKDIAHDRGRQADVSWHDFQGRAVGKTINAEIAVQGKDLLQAETFGDNNERRVRQVHRRVLVLLH